MDIAEIRAELPVVERWIYFDNAGVAPLLTCVKDAVTASLESRNRFGKSELELTHRASIGRCRAATARILGASAADVALTHNTSEGLNVIAQGFPWREGDNVVTANVEYPSNVYPWLNLERRGVEVRFVEHRGGLVRPEDIEAALDERTRILAISHVEFVSGQVNDLERLGALCHRRGIRFVVDAAQSLGALAIDVAALRIHALAACGWKWLMGPLGTGLLYCSPALLGQLALTFVGPDTVPHGDPLMYQLEPRKDAARFEYSTHDDAALAGLTAALDFIDRVGASWAQSTVQAYVARLREELLRLGCDVLGGAGAPCSGIVSFRAEAWGAAALTERLRSAGIFCGERCGYVRFSPHFYNTEIEMDRALAAVADALRASPPTLGGGDAPRNVEEA